MALVKHLLRVVGREATLARQGQLRVVGLGFQLGDQVMQRLGTLLVQRRIMRQQAGQRMPVGGLRGQTGAQEGAGRGNPWLAVGLDPSFKCESGLPPT